VITNFLLLLLLLALTVPPYWWLPADWVRARLSLVIVTSCLLLWILSPVILAVVAVYGVVIVLFSLARRLGASPNAVRLASWTVFVPLFGFERIPPDWLASGLLGESALSAPAIVAFALLGVSYTAIRSFILIREGLEGRPPSPLEAFAGLVFFGSFVAGPIAGSKPWQSAAPNLTEDAVIMALARIGWGGAMFLVIKPLVMDFDIAAWLGIDPNGTSAAWALVYQRFAVLYIDFSGYSSVAIGCGLLFGIRLPENFNWPVRARSIQEFWQRWHMSLGAFIGTYLFRPMVRQTGRPALAIFVAFTAIGLWHHTTWPYLVWGIGHGAALALNMVVRRHGTFDAVPDSLRGAIGWLLTMTYVSLLSSIANAPEADEVLPMLIQLSPF
jgi:D-alanyl-lipoteichoic acid acyltransferase DltB (MBOAT superfamily)